MSWNGSFSEHDLAELRSALADFTRAVNEGRDAVGPDFQFHLAIMHATHNRTLPVCCKA